MIYDSKLNKSLYIFFNGKKGNIIGKQTIHNPGRVGLISPYSGTSPENNEIWICKVLRSFDKYDIIEPMFEWPINGKNVDDLILEGSLSIVYDYGIQDRTIIKYGCHDYEHKIKIDEFLIDDITVNDDLTITLADDLIYTDIDIPENGPLILVTIFLETMDSAHPDFYSVNGYIGLYEKLQLLIIEKIFEICKISDVNPIEALKDIDNHEEFLRNVIADAVNERKNMLYCVGCNSETIEKRHIH